MKYQIAIPVGPLRFHSVVVCEACQTDFIVCADEDMIKTYQ